MRKIVIPGEVVTEERKRLGTHVYMRDGKIRSDVLGLYEDEGPEVNVIPLEGRYIPHEGDVVIGIITAEKFGGYVVDINSIYASYLSEEKVREKLKPGTVISARIISVNELNEAELDNVRIFYGGEIILVSAVKVPRIIGKNGSMLEVLRQGTKSTIVVGRNGRIWAKGGDIPLLIKALEKIQKESHRPNLTNRIAEFLGIQPPQLNWQGNTTNTLINDVNGVY